MVVSDRKTPDSDLWSPPHEQAWHAFPHNTSTFSYTHIHLHTHSLITYIYLHSHTHIHLHTLSYTHIHLHTHIHFTPMLIYSLSLSPSHTHIHSHTITYWHQQQDYINFRVMWQGIKNEIMSFGRKWIENKWGKIQANKTNFPSSVCFVLWVEMRSVFVAQVS